MLSELKVVLSELKVLLRVSRRWYSELAEDGARCAEGGAPCEQRVVLIVS